ncbi:MAG TPA: DUF4199 domain-containing protein [Puia sp.]|nr:DUF4199 domain-containing protein [Puia sp.]
MQPRKMSIAVTYGLITGLVLILLTTILYLGGVNVFISYSFVAYILVIVAAVLAAIMEKKAGSGFLEFREALKAAFLVFVIALLLQSLFTWVLVNFIDTGFRTVLEQATLEKVEKFMQSMKLNQEAIDKALDEQRGKNQYALPKLLLGLCFTYIVCFLISLLIAAIVKRKKPEFHDTAFK